MNKTYAGVGSRKTPARVLASMQVIAAHLSEAGYTLRSGAADGADTAFEQGALAKEIYLPWRGFRGHASPLHHVSPEALAMAASVHPAWHLLNRYAQLLHGRNCYQVLGLDLKTKADFVICWTPGGELKGGTATAIRLATSFAIPVYNLAVWTEAAVLKRVLGDAVDA